MVIWALSDGRRGIANQAVGLANAVARLCQGQVSEQLISGHDVFKTLPPVLQKTLKPKPSSFGLNAPLPDLAVGCGRQAVAPLIALGRAGVKTVYVQDPRINPATFDLVVAPAHDGLTGPNVLTMLGSPNRITADALVEAIADFADELAALPTPRAAILIGGDSKRHTLTLSDMQAHIRAAEHLLETGYSLMVTLSRRTPDQAVPLWSKLGGTNPEHRVWLHDGRGPSRNPYLAFLGAADLILVTEDSTNMLTEAASTRAQIRRLPMSGDAGKFARLYEALDKQCGVTRFAPGEALLTSPRAPLSETDRIAALIQERLLAETW